MLPMQPHMIPMEIGSNSIKRIAEKLKAEGYKSHGLPTSLNRTSFKYRSKK